MHIEFNPLQPSDRAALAGENGAIHDPLPQTSNFASGAAEEGVAPPISLIKFTTASCIEQVLDLSLLQSDLHRLILALQKLDPQGIFPTEHAPLARKSIEEILQIFVPANTNFETTVASIVSACRASLPAAESADHAETEGYISARMRVLNERTLQTAVNHLATIHSILLEPDSLEQRSKLRNRIPPVLKPEKLGSPYLLSLSLLAVSADLSLRTLDISGLKEAAVRFPELCALYFLGEFGHATYPRLPLDFSELPYLEQDHDKLKNVREEGMRVIFEACERNIRSGSDLGFYNSFLELLKFGPQGMNHFHDILALANLPPGSPGVRPTAKMTQLALLALTFFTDAKWGPKPFEPFIDTSSERGPASFEPRDIIEEALALTSHASTAVQIAALKFLKVAAFFRVRIGEEDASLHGVHSIQDPKFPDSRCYYDRRVHAKFDRLDRQPQLAPGIRACGLSMKSLDQVLALAVKATNSIEEQYQSLVELYVRAGYLVSLLARHRSESIVTQLQNIQGKLFAYSRSEISSSSEDPPPEVPVWLLNPIETNFDILNENHLRQARAKILSSVNSALSSVA